MKILIYKLKTSLLVSFFFENINKKFIYQYQIIVYYKMYLFILIKRRKLFIKTQKFNYLKQGFSSTVRGLNLCYFLNK